MVYLTDCQAILEHERKNNNFAVHKKSCALKIQQMTNKQCVTFQQNNYTAKKVMQIVPQIVRDANDKASVLDVVRQNECQTDNQ